MVAVGTYLRTLRDKQGWSQDYVAKKIGVSQKTIERWEAGSHEPGITTLQPYVELVQGSLLRVMNFLLDPEAKPEAGRDAAYKDQAKQIVTGDEERALMVQLASLSGERRRLAIDLIRQLLEAEERGGVR